MGKFHDDLTSRPHGLIMVRIRGIIPKIAEFFRLVNYSNLICPYIYIHVYDYEYIRGNYYVGWFTTMNNYIRILCFKPRFISLSGLGIINSMTFYSDI